MHIENLKSLDFVKPSLKKSYEQKVLELQQMYSLYRVDYEFHKIDFKQC